MNQQLVLVHGLLYRGLAMARLAARFRAAGFDTHVFNYQTRTQPLPDIADQLHRFINNRSLPTMHLVAHSLGGLVILDLLARRSSLTPGRVVLMGTPVNGSELARRLSPGIVGKIFLAASGATLARGYDYASVSREIGTIAGTRPYGLGRLFGVFDEPNDGTVAVAETRLGAPAAHIDLPVTHTGMLFSSQVAEQAIYFLKSGTFQQ